MYTIEKHVAMPTKEPVYPLNKMEVGDSFLVTNDNMRKVSSTTAGFTRKNKELKFKCLKVENGIRVWRIK